MIQHRCTAVNLMASLQVKWRIIRKRGCMCNGECTFHIKNVKLMTFDVKRGKFQSLLIIIIKKTSWRLWPVSSRQSWSLVSCTAQKCVSCLYVFGQVLLRVFPQYKKNGDEKNTLTPKLPQPICFCSTDLWKWLLNKRCGCERVEVGLCSIIQQCSIWYSSGSEPRPYIILPGNILSQLKHQFNSFLWAFIPIMCTADEKCLILFSFIFSKSKLPHWLWFDEAFSHTSGSGFLYFTLMLVCFFIPFNFFKHFLGEKSILYWLLIAGYEDSTPRTREIENQTAE